MRERRYTSDHGFHIGHMRLGFGKEHHYEFDSRVPFLVRGPGVAPGSTARWLTGNVDIAATFLELAGWRSATGAKIPPQMDGRSFATQLMGTAAKTATVHSGSDNETEGGARVPPRPNRTEFLIEFTGLRGWPNQEKPQGECSSGACVRLNDCPNNTYRALRIVSEADYMPGLGKNLLLTEFTSAPDWNYETPNFWSLFGASVQTKM